jgi:hypothetical protein
LRRHQGYGAASIVNVTRTAVGAASAHGTAGTRFAWRRSAKVIDSIEEYKTFLLETAGAELHCFLQRCHYLFEHPEGGSDQPVGFSDAQAKVMALLTGAILDILRTNSSSKGLQIIHADCTNAKSVTLTLMIAALDDGRSAGLSLLARASESCDVHKYADAVTIVSQFTGRSLHRAFDGAARQTG